MRNPKCMHAYTCMHMHTQAMQTHAYCMHGHAYVTRVTKTIKGKVFCIKTWFETNPTLFGSYPKPLFFDYIKP